jgi:diacylglycerol kinase family enzyme
MRRALLIANPAAHIVDGPTRDAIARDLSAEFDIELVETQRRGHAEELAGEAAGEGIDLVVVLGGDGTINEVANRLAGTGTSVGLLPGGGANVLARSMGIPNDPRAAARFLMDRVHLPGRSLPLGRIEGRFFTSNCGVGFDAAIVRKVEAHPRTKHRLGDLAFVLFGLQQMAGGFDRRRPHLRVEWGAGFEYRLTDQFLAIIQNVSPFTFLGKRPLRICPEVEPDEGFDCFALDTMATTTVLRVLFKAFGKADHTSNPHARYLRDLSRLRVRCDTPMPYQADGEYLGERLELIIESVPEALTIVC